MISQAGKHSSLRLNRVKNTLCKVKKIQGIGWLLDQYIPIILLISCAVTGPLLAQQPYISKVWSPDLGGGRYKNPVIYADYSDPDAIRVGDTFYMVASSFDQVPGLPILCSKDLVNWRLTGHGLLKQPPFDVFDKVQHGKGVWAPAIRYHKDSFYIYYPDPDFGIYLTKAKDIHGPWTTPLLVEAGKGLIDPCPLWDDDGKVYLVHGFAGSRAGINSILVVKEMNASGTKVIREGRIVYDGHEQDPTVEGPKIYKRHQYYYMFAPAGGVSTGWQIVLRSKNIYGPYERKVVMRQGNSSINGPHQGAWVTTTTGQDWFLHFRDLGVYGRVTYLEPVVWKDDWPIIEVDQDGDGTGEPVTTYKKPDVGKNYPVSNPLESTDFNGGKLPIQWQWQANPRPIWYFMNASNGRLRLYSYHNPDTTQPKNLWFQPNVLLQKFPAESFAATAKVRVHLNTELALEKAGLVVMGMSYASLAVRQKADGPSLVYTTCADAMGGQSETEMVITKLKDSVLYLRVNVLPGARCQFAYSLDGQDFKTAGTPFQAVPGRWIGAKMGLFCTRDQRTDHAGYMDVDYFHVDPIEK